jgi:hypothetical protein
MPGRHRPQGFAHGLAVTVLALLLGAAVAQAQGRLTLYGLRMDPSGQDAREFSRASWGGGINAVFPVPALGNVVAGSVGFDGAVMMSERTVFQDATTGLRVEQQTHQDYGRFYFGPEFGPHGHGFFAPHAGVDLAVLLYGIGTDVVVPDDINVENEIRQNLREEDRVTMGYDANLGLALNFMDKVAVDGGVRFLKSFNVPQQLGAGSVTIHPGYFQYYLGVGVSFEVFKRPGPTGPPGQEDGSPPDEE